MTSRSRTWDRRCADGHGRRSTLWPKARKSPEFCGENKLTKRRYPGLRLHKLPWEIGSHGTESSLPESKFPRSSQQVFGSQPPEWHDRPPQFARPNAAETTSNFGELADRDPRKKRASHAQATGVI